ncbi:MAG: 2-oxo acid dehydrogenase subunit E2 [Actinomycetia bacterium]|nr:2-oxo acid dehydrogenase subunit E2 [Actinomycetes bacterium]
MADAFVMPKLGLTMEAGTIVQWLVDDGADVAPGQAVLVIETDKVESEVEAVNAGRLARVGEVGQEYPCGANIGWLLAEGEEPPAPVPEPVASAPTLAPAASPGPVTASPAASAGGPVPDGPRPRIMASPNAKRVAAERGIDLATIVGTGPRNRITAEDVLAAGAAQAPTAAPAPAPLVPASTSGAQSHPATIAARNLADLLGVDLASITPSGPDPRLTRDDVAAFVRAQLARAADPTPPSLAAVAASDDATKWPLLQEPLTVVPLAGMRGTIASRMYESLHSMAQLTLTMDVEMDGVVADRERRRRDGRQRAAAPSYTDYVIAATAQALIEFPMINSQITDDGVAYLPAVHVGIAVALDDGLIVPVVHDTVAHDLDALAAETTRLATAARDRKLGLADLEGGTFSVTALGMFDVDAFTPIINAPNTAILGVGRLRTEVALSEQDEVSRVRRLSLSLTWDHRAFDGAPAAEFTRSIKHRLESYG